MFYQHAVYCYVCCKDTPHYDGKCGTCLEKEKKEKHKNHFARLDSMTLEQRVREIEKYIYQISNNPPWVESRY